MPLPLLLSHPYASFEAAIKRCPMPVQAAIWMMLSGLVFSSMGVLIRLVTVDLHPFQVAFVRIAVGIPLLVPLIWRQGISVLRTNQFPAYLLRTFFSISGLLGGFYATAHLPLADSVSFSFTAPLFATLGAAVFLGEVLRVRRIMALVIGFIGVLVILRPGHAPLSVEMMVALWTAAASAGSILSVKRLSTTEPSTTIVAYLSLLTTPIALIPALWVWQAPTPGQWAVMVSIGILGTAGQIFVTRAYSLADASMVLPFDYLRLPITAVLAYLIFFETPDALTFVGAGIIAGSTCFIAWREAQLARRAQVDD